MRTFLVFLATVHATAITAFPKSISVGKLEPNETIAIVLRTSGGVHEYERLYLIKKTDEFSFTAIERPFRRLNAPIDRKSERTLGTTTLSADDVFGLDAYLIFLRQRLPASCNTVNDVAVVHYRDGRKIAEETFREATCLTESFRYADGEVIIPEHDSLHGFPLVLFQAIVLPRLLEEKMDQPGGQVPAGGGGPGSVGLEPPR